MMIFMSGKCHILQNITKNIDEKQNFLIGKKKKIKEFVSKRSWLSGRMNIIIIMLKLPAALFQGRNENDELGNAFESRFLLYSFIYSRGSREEKMEKTNDTKREKEGGEKAKREEWVKDNLMK